MGGSFQPLRTGSKKTVRVPEGWSTVRIRDFAVVRAGATPYRKKSARYFEGGSVPWIKTGDLTNGRIYQAEESITLTALEETSCDLRPPGTVLIAMYGGFRQIGRTGLLEIEAATNQAVAAILHDSSVVSNAYLLRLLNMICRHWRQIAASSRKDPNITKADIERLRFLCPPADEQEYITQLLDTWDRAIEQVSKLIDAKTRLKKGLMQRLLTGKRRFPGFVRSRAMVQTRYGPRPVDWPLRHIGDIAEEVSQRNSAQSVGKVLSCTKHNGLVDSLEYFGKQIYSKDLSGYKIVSRNQFAYATNHIEEGSIGLLDFADAGLVSPMYTVFEGSEQVDSRFLYKLLKTEVYRHIFETFTSASVNRRGSLRWSQFSKVPVALPSLPEQRKIADGLETCETEINRLQECKNQLESQKRGLMQVLLTGKVRVGGTS